MWNLPRVRSHVSPVAPKHVDVRFSSIDGSAERETSRWDARPTGNGMAGGLPELVKT